MAKQTRFSEYQKRYANYRFELTDDGILFVQCHTDNDSLVWSSQAHDDMSDAFADIAGDREIKVLIHTGTGENYNANWGRLPNGEPPEKPIYQAMPDVRGLNKLDEKAWYARHLNWHHVRVQVLAAARSAGIDAIDAPYPGYAELDGCRRAASHASLLGYEGKWAIHPAQVPVANDVFTPTADEIAEARAIIADYRHAEADGVGTIGRDGRLVDAALMRHAENVLRRADT